jgi:hypothetical protein
VSRFDGLILLILRLCLASSIALQMQVFLVRALLGCIDAAQAHNSSLSGPMEFRQPINVIEFASLIPISALCFMASQPLSDLKSKWDSATHTEGSAMYHFIVHSG